MIRAFDIDPDEFNRHLLDSAAAGREEATDMIPAEPPAEGGPPAASRLFPDLLAGFALLVMLLIGANLLRPLLGREVWRPATAASANRR